MALDASAAEFVNALWQSGESHGYAGDFVSGLSRFLPIARNNIPTTRLFYRNWTTTITRKRALPATVDLVMGWAGISLVMERVDLMALFLLGFFCLLRTEELLKLTVSQIVFAQDGQQMLVRLPQTKTTGRRNAPESVLCQDWLVCTAVAMATKGLLSCERLHRRPAREFGDELKAVARRVGLVHTRLTPYTFRRGGATWWFRATGSFDKVAVRGRWA